MYCSKAIQSVSAPILNFCWDLKEEQLSAGRASECPFAAGASETFRREHTRWGSCTNHWEKNSQNLFLYQKVTNPQNLPSKTVFVFMAFGTEKGESLLKDFWTKFLILLICRAGFSRLQYQWHNQRASAFPKAARFCKPGLNLEHFAYQPFSILSLSQTCSLLLSFFHPFLPCATHRFQEPNQTKPSISYGVSARSFPAKAVLVPLCGEQQSQLCAAAGIDCVQNNSCPTAMSDFTSKTRPGSCPPRSEKEMLHTTNYHPQTVTERAEQLWLMCTHPNLFSQRLPVIEVFVHTSITAALNLTACLD